MVFLCAKYFFYNRKIDIKMHTKQGFDQHFQDEEMQLCVALPHRCQ